MHSKPIISDATKAALTYFGSQRLVMIHHRACIEKNPWWKIVMNMFGCLVTQFIGRGYFGITIILISCSEAA